MFHACQTAQEKASSHRFLLGRKGFLFCFQGGLGQGWRGPPFPRGESCPVDGKSDRRQGIRGRNAEPFPRSEQMPWQDLAPKEEADAALGAPGSSGTSGAPAATCTGEGGARACLQTGDPGRPAQGQWVSENAPTSPGRHPVAMPLDIFTLICLRSLLLDFSISLTQSQPASVS